jgi:hypothetical protein
MTVVWDPAAEDQLTRIWLAARDREAIRTAGDVIDATLREDAEVKGMSHLGDRFLAVNPLVVVFDVSIEDRLVRITDVWTIGLN